LCKNAEQMPEPKKSSGITVPAGSTESDKPRGGEGGPACTEVAPPPAFKSLSFTSSCEAAPTGCADRGSDVWVHIYHCDPYTGFLNRVVLSRADIGIYHAGVEVYGEEWSFQYFEDTWNDPSVPGLVRCMPRRMAEYEYQESVNLGPTPFSEDEVDRLLLALHDDWPACSYHLTHNNCLTFAEHFVSKLRPPGLFPAKLTGILEASKQSTSVDAMVDCTWSWVKWWMIRKQQQEEELQKQRREGNMDGGQQRGSGLWVGLFPFEGTCSSALCPGGIRRCSGTNITEESRCGGSIRADAPVPQ